ncbi:hypothetical protein H4Q26_000038 [Puccinia striiformis f. sp. tritici PST-130]|nr:hypothetical protein H4Q26_000038 [Puccinia striiformis f. sp. tritici PST-130]
MSERFRPVALWGAERSRYAPKDSIESEFWYFSNHLVIALMLLRLKLGYKQTWKVLHSKYCCTQTSSKKLAENSFSFGRQRSASVKCPPPRSPGERAESTQPTERSPKRNLPMRKLLQSFSLRLGSGRPKYETLGKPGFPNYIAVFQQAKREVQLTLEKRFNSI